MIYFNQFEGRRMIPDVFAEHSMGIMLPWLLQKRFSFEEGLFITESIGGLLEREGPLRREAMASIIGLPLEGVQKIIQDLDGYPLFIANYNGSMQYVLSGEEEALRRPSHLPFPKGPLGLSTHLQYCPPFLPASFIKRRDLSSL